MFGRKAVFCRYLELLFCKSCRGNQRRPLPWRMIHLQDFTPQKVGELSHCSSIGVRRAITPSCCRARQVSLAAAEFLDQVWEHPVIDLDSVAPGLLGRHRKLARMAQARADMYAQVVRQRARGACGGWLPLSTHTIC